MHSYKMRTIAFPALAALLFSLLVFPACTQDSAEAQPDVQSDAQLDALKAKIQTVFEAFHQQEEFPGAVMAFVLPDGREGAVAVGVSDVEAGTPMTTEDKILSGSIGKTYFAAVAMQLVAEGKLDLDEKISHWLSDEDWFSRLPNANDITVRMLMNHSSGIPEHVAVAEFGKAVGDDPDRVWEPEELVGYILDEEPLFEAGQGWSYADTNYIVLGIILEKITGTALYDELQQRVLTPLGLKDTLPSDKRELPGLIPGYAGEHTPFQHPGKTTVDGKMTINPQAEWTGGGLVCTTMDLARWGALVYRGKAFPLELKDQVLDGVPARTGPNDKYGLGVIIWEGKHGRCLGHSGWFPGYVSQLAYYEDLGISLALQFNTDTIPGIGMKMRRLLDEFAGILAGQTE